MITEVYDVFFENAVIGSAEVIKEGLYTRFLCKCKFQQEGLYRIVVHYGEVSYNIGVCIPDGNGYTTSAKLPSKYIHDSVPVFSAESAVKPITVFKPISPGMNFEYIKALPNGKFCCCGNQKGIMFNSLSGNE